MTGMPIKYFFKIFSKECAFFHLAMNDSTSYILIEESNFEICSVAVLVLNDRVLCPACISQCVAGLKLYIDNLLEKQTEESCIFQ